MTAPAPACGLTVPGFLQAAADSVISAAESSDYVILAHCLVEADGTVTRCLPEEGGYWCFHTPSGIDVFPLGDIAATILVALEILTRSSGRLPVELDLGSHGFCFLDFQELSAGISRIQGDSGHTGAALRPFATILRSAKTAHGRVGLHAGLAGRIRSEKTDFASLYESVFGHGLGAFALI